MGRVLFVSKPVAPPWNDSSKNLVKDLAVGLDRYDATIMTRKGRELPPELAGLVETSAVYPREAGGFAPALIDNARVMLRLIGGQTPDIYHFFFAPNPKSSAAGRIAMRTRRRPSVHTVCSAPAEDVDVRRVLFADVTVVLSAHTEARLLDAGVEPERLLRIPPAIAPLEPLSKQARDEARTHFELPRDEPVAVYPGDLEFGSGAELVLEAFAAHAPREARLVMACRAKTASAADAEARLRGRAAELGIDERVSWPGETRRIHDLLGAADLVLLPSETLYAKMDYPLVLLEAMSLGVPVVVGLGTPAQELCEGQAAIAVDADADAVGSELSRLLRDEDARDQLGARGRRAVLDRYTRAPMAAAYQQLYDALVF